MQVESDKDFPQLEQMFKRWKRQFPMFKYDVEKIQRSIESHIKEYSVAGVYYRQTKQKKYLEHAQQALDEINRILYTVEKLELMAMLSLR